MRIILAAIHGILTGQTNASWPDRLDRWMWERDPRVHVVKKEYRAGPFPRWNCWVRDPRLARGLAAELELFLKPAVSGTSQNAGFVCPPIWMVAHSNGAVIALLAAKRLIARGHKVGGLILTGAACESDVDKSGVMGWYRNGQLGAAIAYSSQEDEVLKLGKVIWPYGTLGRTGWTSRGRPLPGQGATQFHIFTRWFQGKHSCYFEPERIEETFEMMYQNVRQFTTSEALN